MRPSSPSRRSAQRRLRAGAADRAPSACARRPPAGRRGDVVAIDVPPFAARRWTATRSSPRTPRRRHARPDAPCAASTASTPATRRRGRRAGTCVGDRHRRAAAGRRRRGRDGRGDRASRRRSRPDLDAGRPRPEHRPARRRHRRRATASSPPGDLLNPSRIGALAAIGARDVEVFAQPRVAILSTGNEVVEPGSRSRPGQIYDVNRFTLAAIVAAHGGVAEPHRAGAPTRSTRSSTRSTRAPAPTCIVFSGGSSVGERDLIARRHRARGRDDLSRHRRQAGQADGVRHASAARRSSACPATRRRACRTRTSCSCRSCARSRGCRRHAPRTVRVPLGRRIVSPAGRHQFYTVRLARRRRAPGVQRLGRHHQPVAGRRLHRDPRTDRRRSRRDRRGHAVLTMRALPTLTGAPAFDAARPKGRCARSRFLARGRLLAFHRGTW